MAAKAVKTEKPNGQGKHFLQADKREVFGRKVKQLRRDGILPANIYGKKIKSLSVQVSTKNFQKLFEEVGETGLVQLQTNGEAKPVLIHNVQFDSVSDLPLHADFLQVDLHEKVTATVPVEFIGESPLEKTQEGIVVPQVREVEVEALPTDLPEKIEVDTSGLDEVGKAIKIADLKVDRDKVEIKDDPERIVVSVEPPAKEEEPEPVAEEAVTEGEESAPVAEGETPVEGEEQKPEESQEKSTE